MIIWLYTEDIKANSILFRKNDLILENIIHSITIHPIDCEVLIYIVSNNLIRIDLA